MRVSSRHQIARLGAGICLMAPLAAAPAWSAFAQDGGGLNREDIDQILRELRETKEQVKDLQQEVTELRNEDGEQWLSEERAKEIRALVSDVLEDSDHRASLLQDGAAAGWTPSDGFFLASPDGDFLLTVAGLMQFRWIYNFNEELGTDEHRQGFEFARTKLTLAGHVFNRDIEYLVRGDVTRNEPGLVTGLWFLQDAWIRFRLNNDWTLTAGQFKVPFNREELVSPGAQLAVERSLLNETLNLGRSQGVQLTWTPTSHPDWRVLLMTGDGGTDNLGDAIDPGGAPINSPALTEDVEIHLTGRAEYKLAGTWEQFEDFTSPVDDPKGMLLGAALHYQRGEHGGPGGSTPDDWTAATIDFSLECGGANLFAAAMYHQVDTHEFSPGTIDAYGATIQGGYYFTPKFEAFGRYEWGQAQISAPGLAFHTLNVATVGFNYYVDGHDVKFTTDFGYAFTEVDVWTSDLAGWRANTAGNQGQIVFRTQLQLLF